MSAHFSHIAGFDSSGCEVFQKYFGGGESYKHISLKKQIFDDATIQKNAHGRIKEVHLEYRIGKTIADVAIIGSVRKIAVEIQISPLSLDEIHRRMTWHAANGFSTLWVLDPVADAERMRDGQKIGTQYQSKALVRDVHFMSEGSVFFYANNLRFHTAHLMGNGIRYKHYKFTPKIYSLFELIDDEFIYEDLPCRSATIPKNDRWWLKFEQKEKYENKYTCEKVFEENDIVCAVNSKGEFECFCGYCHIPGWDDDDDY